MARLKRRGVVWYAWIPQPGGGTRLLSTNCTDKRAAERKAADMEREALDPAYAAANATTIERVLSDYRASRERLGRAEGTLSHVDVKSGHLVRVLADELDKPYARDLSHALLCTYVDRRRTEGARNTTIKKELRVFGAAWKLARRNELVDLPLDRLMPELEDDYRPRKRALAPLELVGLAAVLPAHRMASVAYMVATACDWSAVARAKPEDVSRDGSMVHIRGTKRESRDRDVPLPLPEQRTLVLWAVAHADGAIGGRLFSGWSNARRDIADACTKIGIDRCSPNDLRRTYAKWCRNAGIEPALVGPAMGHADGRMVERIYGKLTADELGQVMSHRVRLMSGTPVTTGASEGTRVSDDPSNPPQIQVRRGGIEPPTRGFSVPCSTD